MPNLIKGFGNITKHYCIDQNWSWDQCRNFECHLLALSIDRGSPKYCKCNKLETPFPAPDSGKGSDIINEELILSDLWCHFLSPHPVPHFCLTRLEQKPLKSAVDGTKSALNVSLWWSHWASMLGWIWPISECNLKTRDSQKWPCKSDLAFVDGERTWNKVTKAQPILTCRQELGVWYECKFGCDWLW